MKQISAAMPPSASERVRPSIAEALAAWESERELRSHDRKAVYVSGPITTGPLFMSWFRDIGRSLSGSDAYSRAHRAEVILPNIQRMARFLELLRWRHVGIVIDPTALEVPGWDQATYHAFWEEVIRRHVRRVIFLDGWHFSNGCALEFEVAQRCDIDCVDERLQHLSHQTGIRLLEAAIGQIGEVGLDAARLADVMDRLSHIGDAAAAHSRALFKDQVLDHIAATANVAQFVSFAPGSELSQRFCRIRGLEPNHRFESVEEAVAKLLESSPEGMVNIRSFDPERPEGNPFPKRLKSLDKVLERLFELGAGRGLYTIVNETIDESDGGISGVSHRGVLDFAPDATPRCVDDQSIDTAALPFELGMRLLNSVYGFEPDLRGLEGARIEFSIHPEPRGWLHGHTIIWQLEQRPARDLSVTADWPNRFSRLLGDKAFGLALASAAGLPVPRTTAFGRRFFPFSFGESIGSGELWTRTCPEVKCPGFFGSVPRWHDPYAILADPTVLDSYPKGPPPVPLASVIVQEGVLARYSGRAILRDDEIFEVGGVPGDGGAFMLGRTAASRLPEEVIQAVRDTISRARASLGPVGVEWVYDGNLAWIVQIDRKHACPEDTTVEDGLEWIEFRASPEPERIEEFRNVVFGLRGSRNGIMVIGNVSPLSHWGEIAEIHGVPARFVRAQRSSPPVPLFGDAYSLKAPH
jgi:hypothetical protein